MKANHKNILNRLKRARGQIDGIIKMVEADKYCLDVSTQILAVVAALNSTNKEILSAHLKNCVSQSLEKGKKIDVNEKIDEIEKIIMKLSK
ncbi:metal-sensing transcriptional repressor [Helcococcus ovis]|uniref:metal-sensitive transcriptional regulator n=1 Tax=Helcococcus TaxID=31983 RepID=UPI00106F3CB7|nr:metal-sensing transcriptional repressor [Helcococcus ovis]TFF68920.1 metal-sensitive transcriptional regulator [Helcococcus ovis]WNZ00648.1 metal-sensing transcriptional repressor [Helcococcus ovis]